MYMNCIFPFIFFFNDTATTEIYTLSLHDALPISNCLFFGSCRRKHRVFPESKIPRRRLSNRHCSGLRSFVLFFRLRPVSFCALRDRGIVRPSTSAIRRVENLLGRPRASLKRGRNSLPCLLGIPFRRNPFVNLSPSFSWQFGELNTCFLL